MFRLRGGDLAHRGDDRRIVDAVHLGEICQSVFLGLVALGDARQLLAYSVLGWVAACVCIRPANILRLGEQTAQNIGLNLTMARLMLSGVAVYLAAISVSTVGLIGFVGLVVPHIVRMLAGSNYLVRIPLGLLLGGLVLLCADTLGRSVMAPLEIPAGIVMAVVGGPYFLILMRRGGA